MDIAEWLRREVPHCDDPNNYDEWELRMLEAADEIDRQAAELRSLRALLHEARGALWCWKPVSEYGEEMKEALTDKIDAVLGEGKE